jgi:hypothetical protein
MEEMIAVARWVSKHELKEIYLRRCRSVFLVRSGSTAPCLGNSKAADSQGTIHKGFCGFF